MKRFLLVLLLSVAALAQYPGLAVDQFAFEQKGEQVHLTGRIKNDGTFTAKKVVLEAVGLQGEGDGAEEVSTHIYDLGDVEGGHFSRFDFKFECKPQLTNVLMRVKSAKFR